MKFYPIYKMIRIKLPVIIIISILFWNNSIKGQGILNKESDTNYIKQYKKDITARFYLLDELIGFNINPGKTDEKLSYRPNISVKVGLAGFYKWFGLGLAVKNPFYSCDNSTKGKSSIIDLRINGYGSNMAIELSYQDYKGFYLKNTETIISSWNSDDYYQRPDVKIKALGIIFYYIPNYRKHSIRAAYIQIEKQKKSSGSIMIVPSFLYTNLSADSSLIPLYYTNKYNIPKNEQIVKGKFYNYGISIGYAYTLVFLKDFYINASIIPGFFYRHRKYTTEVGRDNDYRTSLLWLGRIAVGYNSDKFFIGGGGVYGYNPAPFSEGNVSYNFKINQFRVWVGTRFGVKK